jgi:lipopolysaccharide export LptBFGC system permease protein LptF
MSVLSRHVLRRLLARLALFLAIFLGVLVGGQLAVFIGRGAPPTALGTIAVFMLLMALPMALPMALGSAVLATFGEMRRDGELQALAAAGIDPLRAVLRVWPVVVGGVLLSALMWHWVMPNAMWGIRDHSARVFQAMVATKVSDMQPIWSDGTTSAWAADEDGGSLVDLFVVQWDADSHTTVFSPRASWELAGGGMRFTLDDVQVAHRRRLGEMAVGGAPSWSGVVDPAGGMAGRRNPADREPDTVSTRRAFSILAQERVLGRHRGNDCSRYNNARLTLHLRFFMPVGLLCLCIFAAGVAMAFGAAESLLAITVVVAAAALSAYPAIGYVKTGASRSQMDPGLLLWLPGLAMAALGWWMLRHPESARETLATPAYQLRRRLWRPLAVRFARRRRGAG